MRPLHTSHLDLLDYLSNQAREALVAAEDAGEPDVVLCKLEEYYHGLVDQYDRALGLCGHYTGIPSLRRDALRY